MFVRSCAAKLRSSRTELAVAAQPPPPSPRARGSRLGVPVRDPARCEARGVRGRAPRLLGGAARRRNIGPGRARGQGFLRGGRFLPGELSCTKRCRKLPATNPEKLPPGELHSGSKGGRIVDQLLRQPAQVCPMLAEFGQNWPIWPILTNVGQFRAELSHSGAPYIRL